ncbi:MAG: HNH endonuclease [Rhodoferax sp.]|nr:HNH endonuclease [Rhodoferax sp.]
MSNALPRHRHQAFIRQACRCYYCDCLMWETDLKSFMQLHGLSKAQSNLLRCTAEHLQARCEGGRNSSTNIAAACWLCNQRRHKTPAPLDPLSYRQRVQRRIANGRWHPAPLQRLQIAQATVAAVSSSVHDNL